MKTHTSKALGVSAAIAAIAVSLPLAITAQADPPPPEPSAVKPPPDPQGPGCDPIKADLATAGLTWTNLDRMPVGEALAKIPSLSTFSSAISGGLNPAVNIVPVLENGPYVVFAPTNDAFAKLEPAQVEALKTDPAALTSLDYYHVFLGLLGPDDVQGTGPPSRAPRSRSTARAATSRSTTPPRSSAAASRPTTPGSTSSTPCSTPDRAPQPRKPRAPVRRPSTSTTTTTTTTTTSSAAPAPAPAPPRRASQLQTRFGRGSFGSRTKPRPSRWG